MSYTVFNIVIDDFLYNDFFLQAFLFDFMEKVHYSSSTYF